MSNSFKQLGFDSAYGIVVDSARPDLSQFQCNGALTAAQVSKQEPRRVAQQVIDSLKQYNDKLFSNLSIAGPGFINISVNDFYLAEYANELKNDKRVGIKLSSRPSKIIIDFGGPNVAKPMHVGHLRSAIIGDSLQRILIFLGENVISDIHLGDWGTQMGMLICELKMRCPELSYFKQSNNGSFPDSCPVTISQLEEMYPTASKRFKTDETAMKEALLATTELQNGRSGYVALWKHFVTLSIKELKKDFETIGVHFDLWQGESSYKERMVKLVSMSKKIGKAVISDGALVIPVAESNDQKEFPPLILEKASGGYLYATSDLAAIQERIENHSADEIIYVVDKRQNLHFEQVFRAAKLLNLVKEETRLLHVGFGTMNGTDGKPFKTRQGGVMKLADLVSLVKSKALERIKTAGIAKDLTEVEQESVVNKVAIATLKFADLSNHRESDYIFDIDKFTQFEGKTGPYLLYTAVRIKSILRNASEKRLDGGKIILSSEVERKLILQLCVLPDVLTSVRESLLPNYLCDFAYSLAQEFNRFYRECHILSEADKAKQESWISLVTLVLSELEVVLNLLGIEIPEKM